MQNSIQYLATVEKEGNQYNIQFANIPECVATTDTLDNAYDEAKNILDIYLTDTLESGNMLPTKSEILAIEIKPRGFMMNVSTEVPQITETNIFSLEDIEDNLDIANPALGMKTSIKQFNPIMDTAFLRFIDFKRWLKFKGYTEDFINYINKTIIENVEGHNLATDRFLYNEEAKVLATQITKELSLGMVLALNQAEMEYMKEVRDTDVLPYSKGGKVTKQFIRLIEETLFYRIYGIFANQNNNCGEAMDKFLSDYILNFLFATLNMVNQTNIKREVR